MAVLIDASILIEAERGRLALEPHVERHQDEESFLSVITASELLHGVHRATRPDVRAKRSAFVEGILERFPLLSVDLACARAHARVWAELRGAGTIIGPHDLWLAADLCGPRADDGHSQRPRVRARSWAGCRSVVAGKLTVRARAERGSTRLAALAGHPQHVGWTFVGRCGVLA